MEPLKESSFDFKSIARAASVEIVVKGSKFISNATPVADRAEAEQFIAKISSHYQDATHNCYAYRIGAGLKTESRFSDAGEPSGTAGRPILQTLESKEMTNIAVVVTRYFGGTKLGMGGLVRAYRAATEASLEGAMVIVAHIMTALELRFAYQHANTVHNHIDKFKAQVQSTSFDTESVYRVEIQAAEVHSFTTALVEALSGQIGITECK